MFYNRGWWGRPCGFIMIFIGAGMLLAILLPYGWITAFFAVIFIICGIYLVNC